MSQIKQAGKLHREDDTGTKTLAKPPTAPQRFTWSLSATQPQLIPHVRVHVTQLVTEARSHKLSTLSEFMGANPLLCPAYCRL